MRYNIFQIIKNIVPQIKVGKGTKNNYNIWRINLKVSINSISHQIAVSFLSIFL
jgi:hypothetical protein